MYTKKGNWLKCAHIRWDLKQELISSVAVGKDRRRLAAGWGRQITSCLSGAKALMQRTGHMGIYRYLRYRNLTSRCIRLQ